MKEETRERINPKLKTYIDQQVLPRYAGNIGGHGIDHIMQVIQRSFEIVDEFGLDVDPNKVYVVAAYHDIGYPINADEHEEVSAQMFLQEGALQEFFDEEERRLMAEAIVDHRASLEYEARNIYGKIVSSADREISVENMLIRSLRFQRDKHWSEKPTLDQIIEYSFQKLSSKYGKGGYAKMYFPDQKYQDYLAEMQALFTDKNHFIAREKEIAARIQLLEEKSKDGEGR